MRNERQTVEKTFFQGASSYLKERGGHFDMKSLRKGEKVEFEAGWEAEP